VEGLTENLKVVFDDKYIVALFYAYYSLDARHYQS